MKKKKKKKKEKKEKGSHYFHTISLYFRTIGTEISKNDAQNHSVFDIFTPNDAEKKKMVWKYHLPKKIMKFRVSEGKEKFLWIFLVG